MTGLFPEQAPRAEAAIRDLGSQRPAVRVRAADALGDVRDPDLVPEARRALIKATDDLRPDVRAAAALSLGELGGSEATTALIRCLDDGNSDVRQAAAVALGTIGDKAAVPALIAALESSAPDLRFQVATSLAEIDPDAARDPLLRQLSHDEDAEVVAACALALGAIGEKRAADKLAELIPEHGPKTSFDLAYALADLGDTRAAPVLAQYLGNDAYGWDAVVGLERIGGAAAIEPLTEFLAQTKRTSPQRLSAAGAVLRLGATGKAEELARTNLIAGLGARKLELRGLAIELIAELGGAWAITPLRGLRSRWAGRSQREEIDEALARLEDKGT